MKHLKPFNYFLQLEMINPKEVETSYLKMRPKRFKEFNDKLKELFRDDIEKYDDFVDFKKAVMTGEFGTEDNVFGIKFTPKYQNIQFDDKDLEDYWGFIKRDTKSTTSLLFNLFNEVKGRPERAKMGWEHKSHGTQKLVCKITSVDDIKILGPIKREHDLAYTIKLPQECLDLFKGGANITDVGDKRNLQVTIEKTENRIHFPYMVNAANFQYGGLPEELRGNKLAHWIYLAMVKKLGYISSSSMNSPAIKQVYFDLISKPEYENEIMSLLLQYEIIIFDRKKNPEEVKGIFREFIRNKHTKKSVVKCSSALKDVLGCEYDNWYNSLSDSSSSESIDSKIKKYDKLTPKFNDTVIDLKTGIIYKTNGVWKHDRKGEVISLYQDYEFKNSAYDAKRYKVITPKSEEPSVKENMKYLKKWSLYSKSS